MQLCGDPPCSLQAAEQVAGLEQQQDPEHHANTSDPLMPESGSSSPVVMQSASGKCQSLAESLW